MNIEEIRRLYQMAQALEAGKEPTTNLKFSQDTILNSKAIKQYNHKVAELLGEIIYAAERSEKMSI